MGELGQSSGNDPSETVASQRRVIHPFGICDVDTSGWMDGWVREWVEWVEWVGGWVDVVEEF